ncbi:MAG: hypothetical protein AAGA55_00250 [Planctomycetota bacterium]
MTRCRARSGGINAAAGGWDSLNSPADRAEVVRMDQKLPADRLSFQQPGDAEDLRETKPDPLAAIAVDANALAGAMASGRGDDLGRLITDLLRERPAA